MTGPEPAFEEDPPRRGDSNVLILSLGDFEGPIDLLLALARRQKVDLARISILELVEQYLAFIETARRLDLELAAEYLVMAAWLAYMKSRLLVPDEDDGEASAEEMAEELAHRLRRLDAMRTAGEHLFRRPLLGRERHPRGARESREERVSVVFEASFRDLLVSYADVCRRRQPATLTFESLQSYSMEEALVWIRSHLDAMTEWTTLARFLPQGAAPFARRSALASAFAASLEMTREGAIELRQDTPFGPVLIRSRGTPGERSRAA